MDRPDLDAIEGRLRLPYAAELLADPDIDDHCCARCGESIQLRDGCEWENGRDICDECVGQVLSVCDLAALLAYARALEAEIHWHEDRNGTRSEQEQQDAEWAADDEKIDAMSDDEIRASLEASGVRVDEAIRRSDALIRVCTERVALAVEVDRLTAERDRLALTLRCERGEWAPEGWAANPERPTQWGHAKQNLACYRIARGLWVVVRRGRLGPPVAEAPTALEAIEAADAALREVAGG